MSDYKGRDVQLYETWKADPSKKNLGHLVDHLYPLIGSEVGKLAGSVPTTALSANAKKQAVHAIKTYDPNAGASLATHVYTWLQKVKRVNYQNQNAARLAENQQLKFRDYNMAKQELTTQLNRDPNPEEMAKHLGWTPKQVQKFQNELFNDFYESGSEHSPEFAKFNSNKIAWEYMIDNLTPDEKHLFDTIMKAENSPTKVSAVDIAGHLGVNLNRYNYLRGKLVDKLGYLQKEIGEF